MNDCYRSMYLLIFALIAGCSGDAAKRTAYETLQNVRQQECMKNMSPDCDKRYSYDDYQSKRKELEPSK